MKKLVLGLMGLLVGLAARGQSIPNPQGGQVACTGGYVGTGTTIWTVTQWANAWECKADATNGVLTTPTLISPVLQGSSFTGSTTLTNATLTTPSISSPVITGTVSLTSPALVTPTISSPTITGTVTGPVAVSGGLSLTGATGGAIYPAIPAGLTFSQLTQEFTSSSIATGNYPNAYTSDYGLVSWNGSAWISGQRAVLFHSAVPMIYAPSGTMGNNCAITLGTALDATYPSAYIYLPSGAIATGSSVGWYYVVMSSTTLGTCYQQQYTFGQPIIPASPTAWATTGPGAFTGQTTYTVFGNPVNVPAYALGLNGRIETHINASTNNNANSKNIGLSYAGLGMGPADVQTTGAATLWLIDRIVTNMGVTNAQQISSRTATMSATPSGTPTWTTTVPYANGAADTTKAGMLYLTLNRMAAGSDWIVVHGETAEIYPAGPLDTPFPSTLPPASASIVPPCAAAFGYTVNKWFIQPTTSMLSIGGSTPLQSTVSVSTYYSNATINGVSALAINQLGDGINPNFSTNTPSTLPPISSANGWYMEAAMMLSNAAPDHWSDIYSDPTEKNGSSSTPFVEVDGDEQLGSINAVNQFYGSTHSTINWASGSGGSGTSYNNLSAGSAGQAIDRTKWHVFGMGYDPVGQQTFFCIDGRREVYSTQVGSLGFNANIGTLHYFIVIGAQSHTAGAGGVPYIAYVPYFSGWSSQ